MKGFGVVGYICKDNENLYVVVEGEVFCNCEGYMWGDDMFDGWVVC